MFWPLIFIRVTTPSKVMYWRMGCALNFSKIAAAFMLNLYWDAITFGHVIALPFLPPHFPIPESTELPASLYREFWELRFVCLYIDELYNFFPIYLLWISKTSRYERLVLGAWENPNIKWIIKSCLFRTCHTGHVMVVENEMHLPYLYSHMAKPLLVLFTCLSVHEVDISFICFYFIFFPRDFTSTT